MRKILITGASGYLGKNLRLNLKSADFDYVFADYSSHKIYSSKDIPHVILNEDFLNKNIDLYKFDHVIHMAVAGSKESYLETFKKNVFLSLKLLKYCIEREIKFLYTRSFWEDLSDVGMMEIPYTKSKKKFHDIVISQFFENKELISSISLGDVYGLNDRRNKLLPYIIKTITNNSKLELDNPNNLFFPTYLNDVVKVINGLINETISSNHYKLYPKRAYSIQEIILFFNKTLGAELKVEYKNRRIFKPDISEISGHWPMGMEESDFLESLKNIIEVEFADG